MMNGMGGFGMGIGWFFWLILIAVIVWAVIKFANTSQNRQNVLPPGEDALEILKKRYAQGEITREEFEQMKKDIKE